MLIVGDTNFRIGIEPKDLKRLLDGETIITKDSKQNIGVSVFLADAAEKPKEIGFSLKLISGGRND